MYQNTRINAHATQCTENHQRTATRVVAAMKINVIRNFVQKTMFYVCVCCQVKDLPRPWILGIKHRPDALPNTQDSSLLWLRNGCAKDSSWRAYICHLVLLYSGCFWVCSYSWICFRHQTHGTSLDETKMKSRTHSILSRPSFNGPAFTSQLWRRLLFYL